MSITMESDQINLGELQELIETLGGVDGSHEVLSEVQATHRELTQSYEKCSAILMDVLEFGLWFLQVDNKEKRAVRKDLVRGNRNELNAARAKQRCYDGLAEPLELGTWQEMLHSPMYPEH